jgi:hypothetical protein
VVGLLAVAFAEQLGVVEQIAMQQVLRLVESCLRLCLEVNSLALAVLVSQLDFAKL